MPKVKITDAAGLVQESGSGFECNSVATLKGNVRGHGELNSLGAKKFQSFTGTLADTNAAAITYADGDVLVELGTLNVEAPAGHVTATKILIEKVTVIVTTVSANAISAMVSLSATSGTATNAAVSSGTEVVGAGATYILGSKGSPGTEADIDLAAAGVTVHEPNIAVAVAKKQIYMAATSTAGDALTAGRFTVLVEYTVF